MAANRRPAKARSTYWYEQPGVDPVIRELVCLRDVGLLKSGVSRTDEMPLLIARATACFPNLGLVRDRLTKLIISATAYVSNEDYKEAIRWEFGALEAEAQSVARRREHLWSQHFKVSERTFRRDNGIERRILETARDAINRVGPQIAAPNQGAHPNEYVKRRELDAKLYRSLERAARDGEKQREIAIVGEPGSGVTRMIYEAVKDLPDVVLLEARNERSFLLSLAHYLDASPYQINDFSEYGLRITFNRMLIDPGSAPRFVVLDGILDWTSVQDVVRVSTSSVLISSGHSISDNGPDCIRVGELSYDESFDIARSLCPDADRDQLIGLATTVGSRVKALVQACGMLNANPKLQPRHIDWSQISSFTAIIRAATPIEQESSLVQEYENLLTSIEFASFDAMTILEFLAFAGHDNMTENCVVAYLLQNPAYWTDRRIALGRERYIAARRQLLRVGIIQIYDDRLRLDPFTARLVRGIRLARRREVGLRLINFYVSPEDTDPVWNMIDLLEIGWAAEDVAAYLTSQFASMSRIDLASIYNEGTTKPVRDSGESLDEPIDVIWQHWYLLARHYQAQDIDARGQASAFGIMPRIHLKDFLRIWLEYNEGYEFAAALSWVELDQFVLREPPSADEVNEWRMSLGMTRLATVKALDTWMNVFAIYQFIMTISQSQAHLVPENMPTGRKLAVECYKFYKSGVSFRTFFGHLRDEYPVESAAYSVRRSGGLGT